MAQHFKTKPKNRLKVTFLSLAESCFTAADSMHCDTQYLKSHLKISFQLLPNTRGICSIRENPQLSEGSMEVPS